MSRFQTKQTLEAFDRLYVWDLGELGFLPDEGVFSGNWGWESGRGIAFSAFPERLELRFYADPTDRQSRVIRQVVPIERTPCNFGGTRPWFRCPTCGGRVAMLVADQNRFCCRRCRGRAKAP